MHRTRTLAAVAVLALALSACQPADNSSSSSTGGGSAGGDKPNPYDNSTDDSCYFKLSPLDTGIALGASIKGTVEIYCKVPPSTHVLDLRVQRIVNGAWVDQGQRTWSDIPPPIPVFKLATAPCVPGLWRVLVSVHGTSATGKAFDHEGFTGMTKKVDASDCG